MTSTTTTPPPALVPRPPEPTAGSRRRVASTGTGDHPVTAHSLAGSVALHVGPGMVVALAYVALVPLAARLGLPSAAALAATGLVAIPVVELGIVAVAGRRARRAGTAPEPLVPWRSRLPAPRAAAWTVAVILAAAVAFAASAGFTDRLRHVAFGWWPAAWEVDLGTTGRFSGTALVVTAGLLVAGSVVVAPIVEERYFRGYLLPRMPDRVGRAAPVAHAVLFGLYHLWTPWLLVTRALAVVPLVGAVGRTRDRRIGVAAHAVLNAVDVVVVVAALLRA